MGHGENKRQGQATLTCKMSQKACHILGLWTTRISHVKFKMQMQKVFHAPSPDNVSNCQGAELFSLYNKNVNLLPPPYGFQIVYVPSNYINDDVNIFKIEVKGKHTSITF